MNIRRNIRVFFARYGKFLFTRIGIIALVVLAIQGLNKIVIKNQEEEAEIQKQVAVIEQKEKENRLYIEQFIEHCNKGEIEKAYNMLSEEYKLDNYDTIEEFRDNYINKQFKYKQEYKIVKKTNKDFEVKLKNDILETGGKESIEKTKTFTIVNEQGLKKIEIKE